jgi:hypothetical protein
MQLFWQELEVDLMKDIILQRGMYSNKMVDVAGRDKRAGRVT